MARIQHLFHILVICIFINLSVQATIDTSKPRAANLKNVLDKKPNDIQTQVAAQLLAMAAKHSPKSSADNDDIDDLIYELVDDEKKGAIRDKYETTVLKAITLKSKLDLKIDETILALQNLKNLRRHIENAFSFTNRFIKNKSLQNDDIKHYVVGQLENAIGQVESTLSTIHSHDSSRS